MTNHRDTVNQRCGRVSLHRRLVNPKGGHREEMQSQEFNVSEYVKQMSLLLDLQLRDEYRDEIVANFERIKAIAQVVNSFPLSEEVEAAPVFEP